MQVKATVEGPLEATVAVGRIQDLTGNYNILSMTTDTLVYDISKPETLNPKWSSLDAFGDPLGLRYCQIMFGVVVSGFLPVCLGPPRVSGHVVMMQTTANDPVHLDPSLRLTALLPSVSPA